MIFNDSSFSILFVSCLFMVIVVISQGKKSNICNWVECKNGGICQNILNSTLGYQCRCPFGFTGIACEDRTYITSCLKNPCLNNGNCTITKERIVKCLCSKKYKGVHCETLI